MKTKEEVYVVVDSEKKKEKFNDCIKQFGMQIYPSDEDKEVFSFNSAWWVSYANGIGRNTKTKVSIKELRNILAKEYLTKGDVILATIGKSEYILEVESTDDAQCYINGSKYYCSSNGSYQVYNGGGFHSFRRYATEKEKALLNPVQEKKELERGKWYTSDEMPKWMAFYSNNKSWHGLNSFGVWDNVDDVDLNEIGGQFRLATPSEIETALIAEAKKRGLILGSDILFLNGISAKNVSGSYVYSKERNDIHFGGHHIFQNGQWAEVITPSTNLTDSHEKITARTLILELEQKIKELKELL